jgi:hypothetical protein
MADYSINAITRRVVFTGSAGVGPYAFSFEVLDENDVAVYFNTTLLTLTTDYTVTINANGTGSVTIVTGSGVPSTPIASDTIIIIGARDIERVTDFVTAGDLLASSLNEQLDALTIFDQQLAEEGQRSMRAPVYDPALVADGGTLDMTLPSASERAGKNLAFDANGNPEAGEDIGTFRGNWAASTTYYKRDIVKDASNDNLYRVNTEHTSSGTTPISSNADAAKFDLIIDAEAAYNYASDAEKLAINPEDSQFTLSDGVTTGYSALHHKEKALDAQTAAEAAQTAAETAKIGAETAETNAQTAQTAAENARDATLAAYDNFDDRYLGVFASDPTVDNDGDPLVAGSLYFNSADGVMKIYTGSAWVAAYVSGTGFLATTGGTMTGDIVYADDAAAKFGDDTDLTIVHDSGVNNTLFKSDTLEFKSKANANLTFKISPGATKAATLYYQGTERVAIQIGGTVFSGGIYADTASIANLAYPTSDGTAGQVLKTDGAGSLSFGDAAAGGAGYFLGENGATGDTTNGKGDIFRVHEAQLDTNVTIDASNNAMCAGPLTVATGVTVTVNGNLVIA